MSGKPRWSKYDVLVPRLHALGCGQELPVPDALIPKSTGNARCALTRWMRSRSLEGFRVRTTSGAVTIVRNYVESPERRRPLRIRAIRGAWAVARRAGIEPPALNFSAESAMMSRNEDVRRAMIRAWEAGYRQGRADR